MAVVVICVCVMYVWVMCISFFPLYYSISYRAHSIFFCVFCFILYSFEASIILWNNIHNKYLVWKRKRQHTEYSRVFSPLYLYSIALLSISFWLMSYIHKSENMLMLVESYGKPPKCHSSILKGESPIFFFLTNFVIRVEIWGKTLKAM